AAFRQRPEGLIGRNGGADLEVVPRALRFRRLLHLDQVHWVDLAAVGAHRALAEQLVVRRQLLHLGDHRLAVGFALERLDRLEIVRDRRIDAGVEHVGWIPLYWGANFFANSRFASLRSQYQASVMISPWEVCSPSACTSVMKASSAASFWPPRTMPNSDACLIALIVSAPALASPMILAFDACACSSNDEKSVAGNGWRTCPSTLPPF